MESNIWKYLLHCFKMKSYAEVFNPVTSHSFDFLGAGGREFVGLKAYAVLEVLHQKAGNRTGGGACMSGFRGVRIST